MNRFHFGKYVSVYTENFPEDLEENEALRAVIDYNFEDRTSKFFRVQIAIFVMMFVVPYFAQLFFIKEGLSA